MRKRTVTWLLDTLRNEQINTWFDLGLFIDRFKEVKGWSSPAFEGSSYEDFKETLREGGIAFLTFHYMVDGITVEVEKYAELVSRNIPAIPVHYIAGNFREKADALIDERYYKKEIPSLAGFNEWDLYEDFYFKRMERGSKTYNALIRKLWNQTLDIVEELGNYLEREGINLIYSINLCSNPGNVAASLALVLLSEYLEIPVINNNHDFYWEGGNSLATRKNKKIKAGPRDFFFTNAHLGEFFSIIEMLFPWESRNWINVNINQDQTDFLIREKGHNPSSVMEIGTAVDTQLYTNIDKRRNINAYLQFERMLSRYRDQLICYSVGDVLKSRLVSEKNPRPILIGEKTRPLGDFISENIIFLQPTRIISRKRIELGFNLLLKIFENEQIINRFLSTPQLKITFLVTGPIAAGHYEYYKKLIKRFRKLLQRITPEFRERVYLALLLGELDRESFRKQFINPIEIPELYNIASLIMLPSKTEGRGLPIVEAAACGTPIFCRRYFPETVYSEVIGENLEEKDRLKVLEFKGKKITQKIVHEIIDRVFFPHNYSHEVRHNKRVVEKRYSLNRLNENVGAILYRLHQQLTMDEALKQTVKESVDDYTETVRYRDDDLETLLPSKNRHYLPGYGRLSFMLMLKSLIDPSYFRMEQQKVRGMVFHFAREIIRNDPDTHNIPDEKVVAFYNAVDLVFKYREGEVSVRHDHSMSYRHRNKYYYPYQAFTFQEITGLINLLYLRIVQPMPALKVDLSPQFFTDWNLALLQLSSSTYLAIDDRQLLIRKLKTNIPIAYFPGEFIMYELELFALQSVRSRLRLPIEVSLTRELLEKNAGQLATVYIFAQDKSLGKQLDKDEIRRYIVEGKSEELRLLYEFGIIQIIRTRQLCVGIHFPQLGNKAIKTLRMIRDQGGYLLTNRRNAALMTDMFDMDRFHIGRVMNEWTANIMGIPVDSGYIQYVPAGVRYSLAYPVPVQTAKDFNEALKGSLFGVLRDQFGEEKVLEYLRKDAEEKGSPIMHALKEMAGEVKQDPVVSYEYVNGIYEDGQPYNGVIATMNLNRAAWEFTALTSGTQPKSVLHFVEEFNQQAGKEAKIAWNGGYILNPELVGKLGLPESYIGSPLGMLVSDGEWYSVPLFNKAALLIYRDGSIAINRVNCRQGLEITLPGTGSIQIGEEDYNPEIPGSAYAYYDLMYPGTGITGNGRILVRLAGNMVKEIIYTRPGEQVEVLPVGLTLSIHPDSMPPRLQVNDRVDLKVMGFENVKHAIEAGPMLLQDGKVNLDMEKEGWKTQHSIRTQAARLDYTDMRGPKIAAGISEQGNLSVLTINGRIRESVGATHHNMALILQQYGMKQAMGFDPGGSSTLVVNGETLNISPYNSCFENNVYALPPQPRAVSNAVIGYVKEGV